MLGTNGNAVTGSQAVEAVGKKVVYLKRIEFGTLKLDEELEEGEYRELTEEEIAILKSF